MVKHIMDRSFCWVLQNGAFYEPSTAHRTLCEFIVFHSDLFEDIRIYSLFSKTLPFV